MLLQLGCDLAQGNGIAAAMPGCDVRAWVQAFEPAPAWLNQALISQDDLPLLIAGVEHRAWLGAVEKFVLGERASPPPLDLHECRLGSWLKGAGQTRHGVLPGFKEVSRLHEDVHAVARMLCDLKSSGHGEQALERLKEIQAPSQALLAQLSTLAQLRR